MTYIDLVKYYTQKGIAISHNNLNKLSKDIRLESSRRIFEKISLLNSNIIRHKVIPFGTITGRDVIKGVSITRIKKKFWPEILDPPQGYVYALFDYCQQEPAIAACFSGDQKLFETYKNGDLYEAIGAESELNNLSRPELKSLILPYLYGQHVESYCSQTGNNIESTKLYFDALNRIFKKTNYWLNQRCQQAFREGNITCLDWKMKVTPFSNPLTIRNWPIQAAGADILRRACFGLLKADIDLRLTNHDSFLVQIKSECIEKESRKIIEILQSSSSMILDGNYLNVKLETIYNSHSEEE